MNEYYFHLDHLTVGYDKKPLIKDICIGIEKGEIVTLIGPNGSACAPSGAGWACAPPP